MDQCHFVFTIYKVDGGSQNHNSVGASIVHRSVHESSNELSD